MNSEMMSSYREGNKWKNIVSLNRTSRKYYFSPIEQVKKYQNKWKPIISLK